MAEISKVQIGSTTYDIKDATARTDIAELRNSMSGAMHYIGVAKNAINTTTAVTTVVIVDGTTPGKTVTLNSGDVVIYDKLEYVWSDSDNKFHEFGSTGSLKALAFKDSASASYTPAGGVSSGFTGTQETLKHNITNMGTVSTSATYTPAGTVAAGASTGSFVKSYPGVSSNMVKTSVVSTVSSKTASIKTTDVHDTPTLNTNKLVTTSIKGVSGTTTVPNVTSAGTMFKAEYVASSETLKLTAGSAPTLGTAITVATANSSATTVATGSVSTSGSGSAVGVSLTAGSAKTFVSGFIGEDGSEELETLVYNVGSSSTDVATGALAANGEGASVLTGLGTASKGNAVTAVNPTFTGTQATITGSGNVSNLTIADNTFTPKGSVSSTFTGTNATITAS